MVITVADISLNRALQSKKKKTKNKKKQNKTHFYRPFAPRNSCARKWGIIIDIFYQEVENQSGWYDLQMLTHLADAEKVRET